MRVLGIVTARGGSKGLPRKNLAPLLGKPLLAWTAEAALSAKKLSRVVLSTDDEEIAGVGRSCGLCVPFRRPAELAADNTPTIPVLQHAVAELEKAGESYDAILTLQPTNPLRLPDDIDGAINLLERSSADSVISYADVGERHPARMKFIAPDGTVSDPPFAEQFEGQPRQSLPKMFLRDGSIYLTRRNVLMEQNSLRGRRSLAWIIPEERARNIDTPFDLFLAEQMLLRLRAPGPMQILVAESLGFSESALAVLHGMGKVVLADLDRPALLSALRNIDVLWVRLRNRIDCEVLDAAPRLRYILTATTGLNHIDVREAEERGIKVVSLQGESEFLRGVHATAEHTVALMLALLRRIPPACAHAAEGGWNRDLFRGRELYGKTVGIVGFGRIGRLLEPILSSFGSRVVVADPNCRDRAALSLDQLLNEYDLVTLHVNLTEQTRGFFGRDQFLAMKSGSWFVNTARGELVDQEALLNALESGRLAGAALDVLAGEDEVHSRMHPLIQYAREHDNLILTPHIGGCTWESTEMTELFLAQKFRRIQQCAARGVAAGA